jgi:PAS domain S-box-containing protein
MTVAGMCKILKLLRVSKGDNGPTTAAGLRRFASLLGCLPAFVCAAAVPGLSANAQSITSLEEFYSLSHAQAREGRPVRCRGLVVCCDTGWNQLFVYDGAKAYYLNPLGLGAELKPGDDVEITGFSADGGDLPRITNLAVAKLGGTSLPAARQIELTDLGAAGGQWIQIGGRIRAADTSKGRLTLMVEDQEKICLAYVMGAPGTNDFRGLIGSKARLRGINTSTIVDGKVTAASIMVPGTNEISDVEMDRTVARPLPVWSIDALLNREFGPWTNEMVHINGLVCAYKPGEFLVVKDPTGTIRAKVAQTGVTQMDDRVDVWGRLAVRANESILEQATFQVIAPGLASNLDARATDVSPRVRTNWPDVLTTAAQIVKLRPQEAAQGLQVRLRGVITYADPEWFSVFFEDSSDALWVELGQKNIRAGQWVELSGETGPGNFAPVVLSAKAQILGLTNPPAPAKLDVQQLADGRFDSHLVELEGVVRRLTVEGSHLWLDLTSSKGKFRAVIPNVDQPPPTLIDSRVVLRGACGSDLNARHQLTGITLCVPGLDQIKVLDASGADSWDGKSMPVAAVATFNPDRMAGRRVKVAGTVTLAIPGRGFYLQDSSGGIRVDTEQNEDVHAGDAVEVRGFPALGEFSPRLDDALWRRVAGGHLPPPRKATAEQILRQGSDDAQLVQMDARLLQPVPNAAQPKLVLQDGPIIFTANVVSRDAGRELWQLRPGSLLRLTGLCSVQGGESHQPEAFRLLLFQPRAVQLLEAPPAWTARQSLTIAASLALVVIAVLAWVRLLRRQVRRQTEIIRAERNRLRDSQARLQLQFERMPIACITWDREHRATSWNPAATRTFGYSAVDALGKRPEDILLPPGAQPPAEPISQQLLAGQSGSHSVHQHRTKDGRIIFCDWTSTPLHAPDGSVTAVLSMIQDVTEQRQAKAQLDYERDILKTLSDNLPDLIYFKDLQSRLVRASKSKVEEAFSRAIARNALSRQGEASPAAPEYLSSIERFADYLTGKTDFDIYDEERARSAFTDEQEILRTGQPLAGKIEPTAHLDGKLTWHLTTKMPWRDTEGRLIGTFGISRDITFIKEAEAQLAQAHKQLVDASRQAGMAEVATGVLHNVGNVLNSVNVSVNVLAEAVNRSKASNLMAIVALLRDHADDLGQFLARDPKGQQLPRYLEHLAAHLVSEQTALAQEVASLGRNVEHVKNIVAMQQSYAKVAGVQETVPAQELVEDALQLHTGALERHKVRVLRQYDSHAPQVTVDRHKALQVLVNLIGNAKYACDESSRPDKQVMVRIANGDGRVRISVEDNGVGIPQEFLTRIFTLGFTTRKEGHGFGLHNGALAAKEMGGALVAHSDGLDRGAIFTLELPCSPHN